MFCYVKSVLVLFNELILVVINFLPNIIDIKHVIFFSIFQGTLQWTTPIKMS